MWIPLRNLHNCRDSLACGVPPVYNVRPYDLNPCLRGRIVGF